MLFRQLFDSESCTYTYLLASDKTQNAIFIDPVLEQLEQYCQLLSELQLNLRYTLDTHVHADHITASGRLVEKTNCDYIMGEKSKAERVTRHLKDGEKFTMDDIELTALYTPGHTDDSYSYLMPDRVFTGDALLIRSTGRTDFQHGSAVDAYHSLFHKLLTLAGQTRVYPAHDYNGMTVSTIAEEIRNNPRLQVNSAEAYADIMEHLNLTYPKKIDVAMPANLKGGII